MFFGKLGGFLRPKMLLYAVPLHGSIKTHSGKLLKVFQHISFIVHYHAGKLRQIFAIQLASPGFSRHILFIITVRYSFHLERLHTLPVLGSMHESWGHFCFSSHSTYRKIWSLLQYLLHLRVLLVVPEIRFCSAPSLLDCCQTCIERFKNIMDSCFASFFTDRSGFSLRPHTIAFRTCSSFDAIFDLKACSITKNRFYTMNRHTFISLRNISRVDEVFPEIYVFRGVQILSQKNAIFVR